MLPLCDFFMTFIFENDVNVPSESKKQKNLEKGVLKVNDKNSMIRIRTKMSRIRNTDVSGDGC